MIATRRQFLACACAGLLAARPARAQGRLPFCCYSARDGWSKQGKSRIEATPAEAGDASGVPQIVDRIERSLGFSVEIEVFITANREDNAFATLVEGRKLLVVDAEFIEQANRDAGTDWAAVEIIAHEVGHHIASFSDDSYVDELNADYWSGQTLQRLGASVDAAARSMMATGDPSDTATHPNRKRRAQVVAEGWRDARAGVIDYRRCVNCRGG